LVYGRTNNPYDLARTPGGSSGGAAAAIAAGCSPLDVGSDTAGSLRVPAHFCGIATLKPTWGRVSRAGHIVPPGGVVGRCTHAGPLARYVEDLILLLPILSGADSRDPDAIPATNEDPKGVNLKELRVAYYPGRANNPTSPEIAATIRNAVKVLTEIGATARESVPPAFGEAAPILSVINFGDGGDYFRKLLRQCGTTNPGPIMAAYLEASRSSAISGRKYSDALLDWARFRETALEFMSDYDLIICPVCSDTAPPHGGIGAMRFSDSIYFSLLGWPAAVVRAGRDKKGLPIGVQIVGKPWFDHNVLAAALQIEKALGGYKRDFPEAALVGA
jgi:amidase